MGEGLCVVVKVGTRTLTDAAGDLDLHYLQALSGQLCELRREGCAVVLVTSGAIRAGMRQLGLARCRHLREQQAAAAVGQPALMRLYGDFCREYGLSVAQVLLTRGDVTDRRRYLNARNTLSALLRHDVIPIINENDTVATEEIRFGENDQLAAQVVQLVGADLLIFFTDTDGFYLPTAAGPELVREVTEVTEEMVAAAGGSASGVGSGGMGTKLLAARMATRVGAKVIMTRGKLDDGLPPLTRAVRGEVTGTIFHPAPRALTGRRRWLAQTAEVEGTLQVDAGAAEALRQSGRSLLAVGVTAVSGEFEPGALVRVTDPAGVEVGRGLVNWSAADLERIRGRRTAEITRALGFQAGAEVVHRDNFAITDEAVLWQALAEGEA